MNKNRLEAFSDGVIAIILTIMVLEIKVPHGESLSALVPLVPVFLSYVLSFIYVGIYWNNHHHMFHSVEKINGTVLWTNLNLLFWLSLLPFTTGWVGENHFGKNPVFLYGLNLLACAVSYTILSRVLVKIHTKDSHFSKSLGSDYKGKFSLILYLLGLGLTFIHQWIGMTFFSIVALVWFIPDRRFEK